MEVDLGIATRELEVVVVLYAIGDCRGDFGRNGPLLHVYWISRCTWARKTYAINGIRHKNSALRCDEKTAYVDELYLLEYH